MTLRHMKIFRSLCEHDCNTTKTAEALHMTQPAISLAIKELEQYYGVVLFDRIGRRLYMTEVGRQFLQYASHITSLFDDMEKGLKDWESFGILRVGASITIGSQFLPRYVKAFYTEYPGTEIRAIVGPSNHLEEKLLENELDFALVEGIPHTPSIVSEAYMEDHLSIICPADGRYQEGQMLSIEQFKQQKFLLRERGSGTREVFERVTEGAGVSVSPIWEAMSTTALINAVIEGLGIAVLPYRMVVGPVEQGLVTTIGVEGLNFHRNFYIIRHKDKYLTASAKAFLDLCRRYESEYPAPDHSASIRIHFGNIDQSGL